MSERTLRRLIDAIGLPRRVAAHAPLGRALTEHVRTGRVQRLRVDRSGGVHYALDTAAFFTLAGEQADVEEALLSACRGRILDVGAGAGRHALALQARGAEVSAIDVSPICVDLMRAQGVKRARVADAWSLAEGPVEDDPFDTLLFGMQSIGLTATVSGLERMLCGLAAPGSALATGGRIVLDSSAPLGPGFARRIDFCLPGHAAHSDPDAWLAGETVVSFTHRGWRGGAFGWVYIGSEALGVVAGECGFATRVVARLPDSPEYVAVLERRVAAAGAEDAARAGV